MTINRIHTWISLVFLVFCSGCSEVPAVLKPASISARVTADLIQVVFIIAAIGFVVVESILLFTVFKFRNKGSDTEIPTQVEGNRKLEIIWTAAVGIILAIIFFISLNPLQVISYAPNTDGDTSEFKNLTIQVIGRQWYWEFEYPGYKIITANELHIPVDVPVKFEMNSADVIHSFWVPELSGKIDVIPGHVNKLWIQADKPGIYPGQCAEFCGAEHAQMRMLVIAESKEDFKTWLVHQQSAPLNPSNDEQKDGESLFLTGSCSGCHTINGTEAEGTQGPNLTHFASRTTFGGASIENTPDNLAKWLEDPQALKPGNQMPNMGLSKDEVLQLQAFLENLK